MDLVISTLREVPGSTLLRGNHEDFVLKFLESFNPEYDLVNWMSNGGVAAAHSYGVAPAEHWGELPRMITEMTAALEAHPSHVAAMQNADHRVVDQGHVFVHAGLRPDVSFSGQSIYDMMTIRSDFLDLAYDFGMPVIHGHTVTASRLPEIHNYRIAVDTGAEETGFLTAVSIEDGAVQSFIRTSISETGTIEVGDVTPKDFRSAGSLEMAAVFATFERYPLRSLGHSRPETWSDPIYSFASSRLSG
ncbi:serine/threonine protein phosphatase [Agrobacterium rhizogenes]|nr:serine/threonine protein phosphatase [Rhizobium rhizogenes]